MTAFLGYIGKDYSVLCTDTLSTFPKEKDDKTLRPLNYTTKTFQIPQLKSSFSVLGTMQLGINFQNFILEQIIGRDIDSLINVNLKLFKTRLNSHNNKFTFGTIFLIGYSISSNSFKGFKLSVQEDKNLFWENIELNSYILKPNVENLENKIQELPKNPDNRDLFAQIMKIQKQEDEKKDIINQVGIGGEILFTQLGFDEKNYFTISTQIIYQFEDYDKLGNHMI